MTIEDWPLDYGWGHKDWDEDSDVALRGSYRGAGSAAAGAAIDAWLAARHQGEALVDGTLRPVAYEGGASFYHDAADAAVLIHSGGQDAFDSIHWYAGEIAAALRESGAEVALTWDQLAHDRTRYRLIWPAEPAPGAGPDDA
ncbi:MAG: hypothetical protein P3W90_000220 [Paracoccus sp. (in: a-proteobacteria)]|nr:hypothetical protein [Paracoccus sp. (in: a-proteobacteria)]